VHTTPHQDILCWHYNAEQLQDPELVSRLVQRIVVACDLRGDNTYLQLVVVELMNNALDHGVLKLESIMKAEANGFTRYYKERERRLADLRSGWIEVSIEVIDNTSLCIRVLDSGNGFDYRAYRHSVRSGLADTGLASEAGEKRYSAVKDMTGESAGEHRVNFRITDTYGRGLTILNELCDTVTHVGCGNEVVVELALSSLLRTPKRSNQDRLPGTENA